MYSIATLGITDYVVFCSVLGVSFLIGIASTMKASASTEDFLTGGRSMHYLPVGCSMLTSFISSISLLGMSGDAYANGIQLYMLMVGGALGAFITLYTSLPVFANLQLTTMNEYLMMRFKSNSLRKFISFMFVIKCLLYSGICLYAPTIALSAVTSLDMYTYIYVLGVVCTIYSSVGGLRAVVWTDVFQLIIMLIGLIVITVLGVIQAGGLAAVWEVSSAGNRTELFNMDLSPFERHTFWGTFLSGFVWCSFLFGMSQVNLQRISSVPDENAAIKVLAITGVGLIFVYVFIFLSGLVPYAAYVGCDPITLGILKKKEEILPYFVMDRISFVHGLPGLFIAALFSGTLSSLSSVINSAVALIWKDFLEEFSYFKNSSGSVRITVNRILTVIIGAVSIAVAILCTKTKSLIDFNMRVAGVMTGPVYGVFLLGLFTPIAGSFGAWVGLLSSWGLALWMSFGSALYSPPVSHLPYSIDSCNATDELSLMASSVTNWTGLADPVPEFEPSPYMLSIYNVSYVWIPVYTTILCFAVGLLASCFVGNEDIEKMNRSLINPYVRKMYWQESQETPSSKEKNDAKTKTTSFIKE